ncbi:uncharacterized protein LY79DRAFT_537692 [Colletotrichum navitas]|uniref:Uncharacterized protein n=1 Tax=Colletotrichum navitas TaxID=681940 RepID=A0AAD8Q9R8_9PEZI|nr:uncharacterized protein LY79DRAFT_537692 [Colletotrichum navitas]KAK1598628.1 hypothetical protein LY79DRAFT_537692 [Colletotrichum navitas]
MCRFSAQCHPLQGFLYGTQMAIWSSNQHSRNVLLLYSYFSRYVRCGVVVGILWLLVHQRTLSQDDFLSHSTPLI